MGTSLLAYDQDELAIALEAMELDTKPGGWVRLDICTEEMPSQGMLDQVYAEILATGHTITPPTASIIDGVPTTSFALRRDLPYEQYFWPAIIGALVPLAVIGTIVYGLTKIGDISNALAPLLLIGGGIIIVSLALLRQPATAYVERGGKVPYLPSTEPLVANLPATKGPTPEYYKSNPPNQIEVNGRGYEIHMTMPTRPEAMEEARAMRDSGEKTLVMPWEGGYAIYILSPKLKNLPAIQKYVVVVDSGDTEIAPGSVVSQEALDKANDRVKKLGLKGARIYETPAGVTMEDTGGRTFPDKDIIGFEPNTVKGEHIKETLLKSIGEEAQAVREYSEREEQARITGDEKTAELFGQIKNHEKLHVKKFNERLAQKIIEDLPFIADSPEFLADTVTNSDCKNQIDQAFQTAIERVRG